MTQASHTSKEPHSHGSARGGLGRALLSVLPIKLQVAAAAALRRVRGAIPSPLKKALRLVLRPRALMKKIRARLLRTKLGSRLDKILRMMFGRSGNGSTLFYNQFRSKRWVERTLASPAARTLRETQPLISVILPTRNRARRVVDAVQSVAGQTYSRWELLIVDDGSTDDTAAVLQPTLSDPRIRLLQSGGRGVCEARNCGLHAASGDFIAYLDSDNVWTPRYLELMLITLIESQADCAYAVLKSVHIKPNFYRQSPFDYAKLKVQNYIDLNVFVHTRKAVARSGPFDSSLKRMVDWDLILRIAKSERVARADFVGALYDAGPAPDRITNAESPSYQNIVRDKHWVNWSELEQRVEQRETDLTSVIVCVFNQPELTAACLGSLVQDRSLERFEVIVVDNGSDSTTKSLLAHWANVSPQIKVVTNPVNFDFSLGNNIGFAASKGANVIFLNNDTEVTHGWMEPLVRLLRADSSVGAVGPKLLYGNNTVQCAGVVFHHLNKIPYHLYRNEPGGAECVNKQREFQALTGACIALRAADFVQLRGFNPLFVNGCEDLDLCFRLRLELHRRAIYCPESVVYHHEGMTAGRGRYIPFNRATFVELWGLQAVADDFRFYEEDGFRAIEYPRSSSDPDVSTAAHIPILTRVDTASVDTRAARKLEIGVVSIWYVRGITFVAKQVCDALDGDSCRTHVLARWESDRFSNAGPVAHPRVTNGGDDPTPEETVRWARMNRLDFIIFMEVHPNDWKRVDALKAAGFKVLALEMMDILRRRHVEKYGCLDGFICISRYAYDFFHDLFPELPAVLIPWGVPPESVRAIAHPHDAATGRLKFVHVAGWGGVNNRKNTDLLIRAFAKAAPDDAELHLYTQAPLSKYGPECEELVRGHSFFVVHEGTVANISDAYEGKDLLLWPSKREGLGLPILEALAAGVPVMISDGYMMKEWIVPDEHGVIIEATPLSGAVVLPELQVDEDALAEAIRALSQDRETIARFRAAVERDRAVWLWTWQPEVLRTQLQRLHESPTAVGAPATYLPEFIQDFESRRSRLSAPVVNASRTEHAVQSVR